MCRQGRRRIALAPIGIAAFLTRLTGTVTSGLIDVAVMAFAGPLILGYFLLSLVLTVALLALQYKVIRLTGSTAVRADSLHYRSDLLLNGSILLALLLARFGWPQLDALFGLGIAFYILWSALQIARESTAILMDKALPGDVGEDMAALVLAVAGVKGVHDLRTRVSGNQWFVQLHLELPGQLPLHEAHSLCVEASRVIRQRYPQADVMVHADPV